MRSLLLPLLAGGALLLAGSAIAGPKIDGADVAKEYQTDPDSLVQRLVQEKITVVLPKAVVDVDRKVVSQKYGRLTIECRCREFTTMDSLRTITDFTAIRCEGPSEVRLAESRVSLKVRRCEVS